MFNYLADDKLTTAQNDRALTLEVLDHRDWKCRSMGGHFCGWLSPARLLRQHLPEPHQGSNAQVGLHRNGAA